MGPKSNMVIVQTILQYNLERMNDQQHDFSHCDTHRDAYPFASSLSKNTDDDYKILSPEDYKQVGYDKFEGKVIVCVRDNGIGISKKYHHKIFELFERLNRVDEYSGNGLGLAICQKIVEMHGGSIWVESLPGLGSSFYFTLQPK